MRSFGLWILVLCSINLVASIQIVDIPIYDINLNNPASQRYSKVAADKQKQIKSFIQYLQQNVTLYKISFFIARILEPLLPYLLDSEFYQQCKSISKVIKEHTSKLVVFNYMYQLGAYHKFCTSISVNQGSKFMLGRNLDYGFQEYLLDNSVQLHFYKNGKIIYKTIGHAGLIGAHTGLRLTVDGVTSYSVSLNQRIEGGLHLTLQKMLFGCQTAPYLITKAFRNHQNVSDAIHLLNSTKICSPVYYIIAAQNKSLVIQRSRSPKHNTIYEQQNYLVQTNHDRDIKDPDSRQTIAEQRIESIRQNKSQLNQQDIWSVLQKSPNFNFLTIITAIMKPNGQIYAKAFKQ